MTKNIFFAYKKDFWWCIKIIFASFFYTFFCYKMSIFVGYFYHLISPVLSVWMVFLICKLERAQTIKKVVESMSWWDELIDYIKQWLG